MKYFRKAKTVRLVVFVLCYLLPLTNVFQLYSEASTSTASAFILGKQDSFVVTAYGDINLFNLFQKIKKLDHDSELDAAFMQVFNQLQRGDEKVSFGVVEEALESAFGFLEKHHDRILEDKDLHVLVDQLAEYSRALSDGELLESDFLFDKKQSGSVSDYHLDEVDSAHLPLTRNPTFTDRLAFVNMVMDNQGELKFRELTVNGTNSISVQAPASLAADYTLTLPVDDGTTSQVLQTNGSGVLSWVSPGGGDVKNGGNTTGATVTVGTNDAQSLELETNGTSRLFIDSSGNTTYTNNYRAHVYLGSNQTVTGTETIEFDTEVFDSNNNFNTGTHLYTAPITGYYLVTVNFSGDYSNNNIRVMNLIVNGSPAAGYSTEIDRRSAQTLSAFINLTAGDTLGAQLVEGAGTTVAREDHTSISIHFMSR